MRDHPHLPALIIAILGVFAIPRAAGGGTSSDSTERFVRILYPIELSVTEEERDKSARDLARIPGVVPLYLDAVATGAMPATTTSEAVRLSADHLELLERVSELLERGDVVSAVRVELAQGESDPDWRLAALDLMRLHAMSNDLLLMLDLVGDENPGEASGEALLASFREALIAVLQRDDGVLAEVADVAILPEFAGMEIVHAVGIAGDPHSVTWLVSQLGEPDRTDAALQEIGRMAPRVPADLTERVAERLRKFLTSESESRRKQAVRALASLGDERVIPHLVEVLESDASGERKVAWTALRTLSGRDYPARADLWRGWLAEELRWWGQESEATLEQLHSEDDGVVIAAVNALSKRSLQRDRLARELGRVLTEHPSHEVRGWTCLALTQLGSKAACEDLLRALGDPDESIRERAWTALGSITGLSLPLDQRAWQDALAPRS